jgi:hypothetical protein
MAGDVNKMKDIEIEDFLITGNRLDEWVNQVETGDIKLEENKRVKK